MCQVLGCRVGISSVSIHCMPSPGLLCEDLPRVRRWTSEHRVCAKPWRPGDLCCVSGSELWWERVLCEPLLLCAWPQLLCKHPLCVGASVVMAACCVLGTGLLCEHLLCDYFLSASLCGILLLRWGVGCWAHRVDEAFSCGPICFPPPSDHP